MLKPDNTRYADADLIALLSIFQFEVNICLTEGVTCQATPLLGLASYLSTYHKGWGLVQGWYPDTKTNAAVDNTGVFIHNRVT